MIGSWQLPTPFFISSNPEFQGVEGVTDFVGILMAVGSLIHGPYALLSFFNIIFLLIKKKKKIFEMQLLPLFPGREFGKLRFLKWWLFFYVDSSPWLDSNFG